MRALRLDADGARLADLPDPRPGTGEAVVRVALAGVCDTDLQLVKGYLGFRGVLGEGVDARGRRSVHLASLVVDARVEHAP